MTVGDLPPACAAVLIADHDLFQGGYVEAVLIARGIATLGPFRDAESAIAAIETPGLGAAVIAQPSDGAGGLAEELDRRGIPFLTLTHLADDRTGPTLERPFAGYQVADWVAQALGHTARLRVALVQY